MESPSSKTEPSANPKDPALKPAEAPPGRNSLKSEQSVLFFLFHRECVL